MKVSLSFFIFVLSVVSGSYGGATVTFEINTTNKNDSPTAYCDSKLDVDYIEEGSSVRMQVESRFRIQKSNCLVVNTQQPLKTPRDIDKKDTWFVDVSNISKNMSGLWSCTLSFGYPANYIEPYDSEGYTYVHCNVTVKVKEKKIPDPSEDTGRSNGGDNGTIIIISSVIGVIVGCIIVGQTIALIYFKSRAETRNRLDSLVTRERSFDRNDEVRYSAPPSRRHTKTNRAAAETDSHIYEMVGVNALYKESSELDVKNRPPLPLPGESPVPPPVPIDTLPRPPKSKLLSSIPSNISSKPLSAKPVKKELPPAPGTLGKAPCRPPKQLDEASLVGSLPRPPKPGSSMPKMLPTDPALMELKKAIEKRNVGNAAVTASPTPSQQSTLEMKPKPAKSNPPATSKPPAKSKPPPIQSKPSQKTPVGINPLAPNMKLILPKIEASLRPPPSKPSEVSPLLTSSKPDAGNCGPSIHPVKPGVPPFRRPNPEANASSASSAPVHLRLPLQSQTKPRPLPPIQPEEDESNSDDDEWTYEQLGQYNIYNI